MDRGQIAQDRIFEDRDGNLWISSFNGAHKVNYSPAIKSHNYNNAYNLQNGLPGDQVKCVYQDRENNIWFGMYGTGLAMLKDEFFTFYTYKNIVNDINVRSILIGKNSSWLGTDVGLLRMEEATQTHKWYDEKSGFVTEPVTALAFFREYILAGTSKGGLYAFDRVSEKWKNVFISPDDALVNSVLDIEIHNNDIWMGTRGGLVHLDAEFNLQKLYNTESGMSHKLDPRDHPLTTMKERCAASCNPECGGACRPLAQV